MKAILKVMVTVFVAIAAICTFPVSGSALPVPGQDSWSSEQLPLSGITVSRGVEKPPVMRLARFGFGISIGGGGIRYGVGFGGRGWGVSVAVPVVVPAGGVYSGSSHSNRKRRPYGYVEKCTTENGVKNCSWVPKSMYWDWQSEGK